MALYCSKEIFESLEGVRFPAMKDDLLDYAELKDAPEAVVVVLNQLQEDMIFNDISEVCSNARIACNSEIVRILVHAPFPLTREQLMDFALRQGAPAYVRDALFSLPGGRVFSDMDDVYEYIL